MGFGVVRLVYQEASTGRPLFLSEALSALYCSGQGIQDVYFGRIRMFKAGECLNTLAWNNGIGPRWFPGPK